MGRSLRSSPEVGNQRDNGGAFLYPHFTKTPGLTPLPHDHAFLEGPANDCMNNTVSRMVRTICLNHDINLYNQLGLYYAGTPAEVARQREQDRVVVFVIELMADQIRRWREIDSEVRDVVLSLGLYGRGVRVRYYRYWFPGRDPDTDVEDAEDGDEDFAMYHRPTPANRPNERPYRATRPADPNPPATSAPGTLLEIPSHLTVPFLQFEELQGAYTTDPERFNAPAAAPTPTIPPTPRLRPLDDEEDWAMMQPTLVGMPALSPLPHPELCLATSCPDAGHVHLHLPEETPVPEAVQPVRQSGPWGMEFLMRMHGREDRQ